jgi:hypothetical protein
MNNIISFSLWGSDNKYFEGAIRNIKARDEVYSDWKIRFYVASDISEKHLISLCEHKNVEVYMLDELSSWRGLFWRFYIASDTNVDRYIIRDTDSVLNWREEAAVDDWIKSGKDFHIMRDHQFHNTEILGGMWGGCCQIRNIKSVIDKYLLENSAIKGVDQVFLKNIVFPQIYTKHIAHDEFFHYSPDYATFKFPKHKKLPDNIPQFVGGIYGTEKGY